MFYNFLLCPVACLVPCGGVYSVAGRLVQVSCFYCLCFMFLMSLCPVSLLSYVDNYVVFVLCQCFIFLMTLCPVSLLSCVDNYIVFKYCVSVSCF